MKAETRLKKILNEENERLRMMKLFSFAMDVPTGCQLHKEAKEEFNRLYDKGIRMF